MYKRYSTELSPFEDLLSTFRCPVEILVQSLLICEHVYFPPNVNRNSKAPSQGESDNRRYI